MKNTFVSLATPYLTSAIAIIRINGEQAYEIVNKIAKNKIIKKGYSVQKAYIYDSDNIIDECIFVKFVSPRSFTGDDLIEINCHGGPIVIDKIIDLLLKNGARKAENGEFTKRAFLNNKLSLFQANSINNLINSKTVSSASLSINGIVNEYNNPLNEIQEDLFNLIGKIEVNIDYPEYDDVEVINNNSLIEYLKKVIKKLNNILDDFNKVGYIYQGINVAIIGKPNSGKSSLLNALIKKNRAIVTNVAGTTRDIINESIIINDVLFNFVDTAGIRKSSNKIENIGIKKSLSMIKEADFIIFLIDSSKKINKDELDILKKIKNKKYVIVKNKSDLLIDKNPDIDAIKISAKKNKIQPLINYLSEYFKIDENILDIKNCIASKEEEKEIKSILYILNDVIKKAKNNLYLDLLVEDITSCYKTIATLLGNNQDLDLIDKMFKNFCLGK